MPHDLSALNRRYGDDAQAGLRFALSGALGRVAMVSSFGAESAALLHMVAQADSNAPVLFIDTLLLFPETLAYQRDLAAHLGLTGVQVVQPNRDQMFLRDSESLLHRVNPDACCDLRKTQPLDAALQGFDGWVTGRKRFQGGARVALEMFERDEVSGRIKINPLAGWDAPQIAAYMDQHALPRHPLVSRGYPSIGCGPCTGPVAAGEHPRAGRWRGMDKEECGIHVVDGRVVRKKAS